MSGVVQGNAKLKRRLIVEGFLYCFAEEQTVCLRLDRPEVQGPTRQPLRATLCLVLHACFGGFLFCFVFKLETSLPSRNHLFLQFCHNVCF